MTFGSYHYQRICLRVFWAIILVVLLPLFAGCSILFSSPAREVQNLYYADLDSMVAAADRIFVGRFNSSQFEEIIDPETGVLEDELVYHTFTVIETFKGTAEENDDMHVALPDDLVLRDGDAVVDFVRGESYLLFVNGRARDRQFPPQYGGTIWSLNGEPALAQITGENARFWLRSDYAPPQETRVRALELDDLR